MAGLADFRAKHPEYNDMGDVELADALHRKFYADIPRKDFDRQLGIKTSQGLGFYKGLMKPIDNVAMAMETAAGKLGVDTQGLANAFGAPTAVQATADHAQAIARSPRRPGMAGEIAGNVIGTIPATMVSKNPVIAGAVGGAMLTDSRTPGGVAADAAMGGALGWAGGKVVDAVSDFVKPVIDPAVRRLKDAGVSLTPGMVRGGKAMVREDKMISRPVVGDRIRAGREAAVSTFNTAAANRALQPLGVKVPPNIKPGHDTMAFAKSQIGQAYDDVIPRLSVKVNGQAFAQKLAPSAGNLEAPQRKQLTNLLNQHLKNGQLHGQPLKRAHGELRRLAAKYSRDPNAANNELGNVLFEAADDLMAQMIAQNPKYAPRLQQVNTAYRGYRVVAGAAKGADDGIFNTAQLKQSVIRGDGSKSKDAAARGQAFMQDFSNDARAVIPSRVPNSGTADRNMFGNPFATARGMADDVGYRVGDQYQQFRLAPRPAAADKAARLIQHSKNPFAAGLIAFGQLPRD